MCRSSHGVLALLLLVGGVVAALVRAQDTDPWQRAGSSQIRSADSHGTNEALAQHLQRVGRTVSNPYDESPGLARGFPAGRTGGSEASEVAPVAHERADASPLRSVLKRRTTLPDASSDASPGEESVETEGRSPATSSPRGLSAPESEVERPALPGATEAESPSELPRELRGETSPRLTVPGVLPGMGDAEPADRAETRGNDDESSGDTPHVSSRRTHRTPETVPAGPGPAVPRAEAPPIASRPSILSEPLTEPLTEPSHDAGFSAAPSVGPSVDTLANSTGALLRVTTTGPKAVEIGALTQILISVSNLGSEAARGVSVELSLPDHFELVSAEVEDGSTRKLAEAEPALLWSLDRVPARGERVLTLKGRPKTTDPLQLRVEWSCDPLTSVAQIQVQEPLLQLALQGPQEVTYGDTTVFTVTVSNPGTGAARGVNLSLTLGDESADTLQVGTVEAGGRREFQVEVTARQAGTMPIRAKAQGQGELQAAAEEELLVRRAELELRARGSGVKYAGSAGTYELRVTNQGDAHADRVRASVRLPHGARYVQGLEQVQESGDLLEWPIGSLAPGEERVYRFFCELADEGEARFDFTVRGEADLQATEQVVTRVETIADLTMRVEDPRGPIAVGKEVLYEVHITNRGTKEASQVQLIAQFSEGIEPASADGARAEIVPGQVVFHPIARLNPGETIRLTVRARGEKAGNHLFRAELRCGDPEYRLVSENTTAFFADDLADIAEEEPISRTPIRRPSRDDESTPLIGNRPGWTTR